MQEFSRESVFWKGQFEQLVASMGEAEVAERLAAVAPVLQSLMHGGEVAGHSQLLRNVALHAAEIPRPLSLATPRRLRQA